MIEGVVVKHEHPTASTAAAAAAAAARDEEVAARRPNVEPVTDWEWRGGGAYSF
jgi:hypothetical protein